MFFQEVFHASPILKLGNGKEQPTTATCGPKCFEQYAKSDRAGSWGKTFSALLIGMEGWFSNRCVLTWKLKTTPFNRSYFQLAVSTRRTKDTAPGLLPTVTTTNSSQGFNSKNGLGKPLLPMAALMLGTPTATALVRSEERQAGRLPNPAEYAELVAEGLLPTPISMDMKCGQKVAGKTIARKTGTTFSSGLRDLAYSGLLPTPTAFDRKTCHQEVTGKTITRASGETFTAGLRMMAPNGLLPTPNAGEGEKGARTYNPKSQMGKGLTAMAVNGMLPTPIAGDWKGQVRSDGTANMLSGKIALMAKTGNLPTPTARCHNAGTTKDRKDGISRDSELNHLVARSVGKSSQLNPLFVGEMMGFPRYYTVLPFLDGEKSQ